MLGTNIGIDLGTTSTVIYVQGKGILISEPSAIAYDTDTGDIIAVGQRAYEMYGKTPDCITVVRPLEDGVVSDFTATQQMLSWYLHKVAGYKFFKPNIVVCMPSGVTDLEKRTLLDIATLSGAGRACLIEEPLAAAVGAGIKVTNPSGTLVVDIGGGTTDIAVITMGSIAVSDSVKGAGNGFDKAIKNYLKRERNIIVGLKTAENIKKQIACARFRQDEITILAKGKDYITSLPTHFEISSAEVFLAMREGLENILDGIYSVMERTSPDLVSDIMKNGIYITGGGALILGIDEMIEQRTGIRTIIADDPLNCVAKGTGMALKDINILQNNGYIFKTREQVKGYSEDSST